MWALYGANPYLHGPHAIALDPLYPYVGAKWVTMPSAYGPLFTALSVPLAGLDIATSAFAYKLIAALATLALVATVWNGARLRGLDPVKAAALVGLNPLLVLYGVGGGHNDLLMLALLLAGVYLLLGRRDRAAGGMIVVSAGIKLTALLLLPFAVAGQRPAGAARRGRAILVGASAAAVSLATVGLMLFGTGPLKLVDTLQKGQAKGDPYSIPGFLTAKLGLGGLGHAAGIVLGVLFVVIFVWLVRRVWRGELDWIAAAGWATVALLLTASSLLPWYVAWLLPLAALGGDRRLYTGAVILTGVILGIHLLGYVPHGMVLGL
jgi:alpha-1,6-mannosyltransferase